MNIRKKVLVIDDDLLICEIIGKILDRHGLESVQVLNGREAQAKLRKEGTSFAMAIVDLILPDGGTVTGWDILDIIRNNPGMAEMPVMVITGAKISANETKRLKQQADSIILKKDFDIDRFGRIVDALLKGKKDETQ